MIKLIPRRVHGILDYIAAAFLLFWPLIFQAQRGSPASHVPFALGVATVLYSLLTNYEWGLYRFLRFRMHLVLDLINGILLTLSPWLFHFETNVWLPQVAFGVFELCVVGLSQVDEAGQNGNEQSVA